jgi:hypothetical protein
MLKNISAILRTGEIPIHSTKQAIPRLTGNGPVRRLSTLAEKHSIIVNRADY